MKYSEKDKVFASRLSLAAGIVILGFKFWAYNVTGSQGAYSDALESIVNVVAAAVVLFVTWYAAQPADRDHPYGHGKVEFFSAAFEGGLIAFAALAIIGRAVDVWVTGPAIKEIDLGLVLLGIAGVGNLLLGLVLLQTGRRTKSESLMASGHHVISDFVTSAAVIVALLLVKWTGWIWLDPAVAILVGIQLAYTGTRLALRSAGGLMDAEDRDLMKEILALFEKNQFSGIIRIHHTRVMRSGNFHHIDAHVVVPEFWNVAQAHNLTDEFEMKVIGGYGHDGEIHFHVDPCRQAYCIVCDVDICPIRLEKFEARAPLTIEELQSPMESDAFLKSRRQD